MASPASPSPPKQRAALHAAQARHNFELYQQIKSKDAFLDWATTLLFYTALQLIDACLWSRKTDMFNGPHSHSVREHQVRQHLRALWNDYSVLQNRSTLARYHPDQPRPSREQLEQWEKAEFARIEAAARSHGYSLE